MWGPPDATGGPRDLEDEFEAEEASGPRVQSLSTRGRHHLSGKSHQSQRRKSVAPPMRKLSDTQQATNQQPRRAAPANQRPSPLPPHIALIPAWARQGAFQCSRAPPTSPDPPARSDPAHSGAQTEHKRAPADIYPNTRIQSTQDHREERNNFARSYSDVVKAPAGGNLSRRMNSRPELQGPSIGRIFQVPRPVLCARPAQRSQERRR